jgi:hypothetical protein
MEPMWTKAHRGKYNRDDLRHPSDLTHAEWGLVQPLIPPAKCGGRKREVDVREVVNGLLYVLRTGCQWRAVPKDLPPKSTLFSYFDLWNWDGTLGRMGPRIGPVIAMGSDRGSAYEGEIQCHSNEQLTKS